MAAVCYDLCGRKVERNSSFNLQVCAVGITNIGTLAARKGGSQHEYKNGGRWQGWLSRHTMMN